MWLMKLFRFRDFFLVLLVFAPAALSAQELQAHVTVASGKIRGVDPTVFKQLQKSAEDFLNTTKWTDRSYAPSERIVCNFLLDLQSSPSENVYSGSLTVQSMRPVYNSSYTSTILNFKDKDFTFRYRPFEQLVFNESRISGNDALEANLTAVLAYYAYVAIGLDQDTFADAGGIPLFKNAQNVVSNAPSNSSGISGWKAFEGTRNRYWLVENLLNTRYKSFHKVLYKYHRQGLDLMYDNVGKGSEAILASLNLLNSIYADNPTTMILPLFFDAKSDELAGIFSRAPGQEKVQAMNILEKLDPQHGTKYREELK